MSRSAAIATVLPDRAHDALRVRELSLSFAGVRALDGVTFDVAQGAVCGIIGPNGAGKSTLLNVVSGVYRKDAGEIHVLGERHRGAVRHTAALGIARTFQNLALIKGMSVLENVVAGQTRGQRAWLVEQALALPRARRERQDALERAEAELTHLGLADHRHARVGSLSYGLQKRVELARALASRPSMLLLDEPMAGMTAGDKEELCALIAEVHRKTQITIVLIEHDLSVVLQLCAQLVVLDYGKLIADGRPSDVVADARVVSAYLGRSD